jgi:hypothetical protein
MKKFELVCLGLKRLTDAGIAAVAAKLPTTLDSLMFNFKLCKSITDNGAAIAISGIPLKQMSSVSLDFRMTKVSATKLALCTRLKRQPNALEAIQKQVKYEVRPTEAITCIEVHGRNTRIFSEEKGSHGMNDSWELTCVSNASDEDFEDDTWAFPEGIQMLFCDLSQRHLIGQSSISALCGKLGFCNCLLVLQLKLCRCALINDEALDELGQGLELMPRLQMMHIEFSGSESVTSTGIASLALGFPGDLQALRLEFWCCPLVGDGGVAALSGSFPPLLRAMKLNFALCKQVTDAGVGALAVGLPPLLEELELNLRASSVSHETREIAENLEMLKAWKPPQIADSCKPLRHSIAEHSEDDDLGSP